MSELTSQDFQLVSQCIAQLNLPCLLADFPNRALNLLKDLVGVERGLCQSFNEEYSTLLATDLMSKDLEIPEKIPIQYLLKLYFALGRTKQNFTERDREILNLFRPHLLIAYHNVLYYTQLQQQLGQLTQVAEQFGTILLSVDGYIQQISNRAAEILQLYFTGEPISGRQLPDILTSWVKQQIREFNAAQPSQPLNSLKIKASGKILSIRLLKGSIQGQWILTFDESENSQLSIDFCCAIGLTKRESEVMFWVVQGLSNIEVATRLNCSGTTVKKHLENIYSKLNVQSRSMAVAIALNKYFQHNL